MRGVVAGTGKSLDGAGQRIASLLAGMLAELPDLRLEILPHLCGRIVAGFESTSRDVAKPVGNSGKHITRRGTAR
jgi:hypothetical protein